jgi:predicted GNAT family acetyltransferase
MYPPAISVFAAVDQFDPASWADLAALVGPSETCALFCAEVPRDLPSGWTDRLRGNGRQMILEPGQLVDVEPIALRELTSDDVPQILDLVARTKPGPFKPRTIEMGQYFGHFDGGTLCAMAGERLGAEGFTEISAVCTLPRVRGMGLASAVTHHVAAGVLSRGERPFLHVAESNESAYRIYRRLGFVQRRMVDFAVITTPAPSHRQ